MELNIQTAELTLRNIVYYESSDFLKTADSDTLF